MLDEDSEEASHVYRTFDEAIFVIQNGKSVQRFSLDWRSVDDYVTSVRDDIEECDWEDQHYYADYEGPFEPRVRSITMEGAA
ncbi:hypothetical protein RBH26_04730 [Natronolimnohabitans sp. A-GB9]|uniref:hypothetical protein n=1 Tax=Natronolimnohabitans sp. A-GB9 TaxID=3069757 RepID=UPI0027AF5E1C|nr:hypothetical protein [Natronolimnohabitans sp. A-GB9]MDQ2049781.1 hypothetical protein [Natronolimnohabitans sp. A-GB9]